LQAAQWTGLSLSAVLRFEIFAPLVDGPFIAAVLVSPLLADTRTVVSRINENVKWPGSLLMLRSREDIQ